MTVTHQSACEKVEGKVVFRGIPPVIKIALDKPTGNSKVARKKPVRDLLYLFVKEPNSFAATNRIE